MSPPDHTSQDFLFQALPALIGALGGSMVAGVVTHLLKAKADVLQKRRDKLEQFLSVLNRRMPFGIVPNPDKLREGELEWSGDIKELMTLVGLYFDELGPALNRLTPAVYKYLEAHRAFVEAVPANKKELSTAAIDARDGVGKAWGLLLMESRELAGQLGMKGKVKRPVIQSRVN